MISILYADRPAGRDGIRDYSEGLAGALSEIPGIEAQLILWTRSQGWPAALADSSSIVLQYNPFSYGRGGFAPMLLAHLGRASRAASLCVMVHEPYMQISDARSAAMGTWQRAQLRVLLGMADAIGISTDGFRPYLPERHRARATLMPVGSPLPDARARRTATRAALGASDPALIIALYGSSHASRMIDQCAAAVTGIISAGCAPIVLNLGSAAPALGPLPAGARVIRPGSLAPMELAAHLAAADVALLPFIDGASTRRTTLVSALQQETCVLTTHGHLTDLELAHGASAILTPAGDSDAFVQAAINLASNQELRIRTAMQGRRLFETRFSWPVIAERMAGALIADVAT